MKTKKEEFVLKKRIIQIILGVAFVILVVASYSYWVNNKNKNSDLVQVKLAEVTHSPFYAPFYVALEKGYFEEEGLDLDLILTPGADKVAAAVLSGDVNIGFAGPESAIYVYEGGEENYLVTFAGLTKRDGQFILGREKNENFTLNDLKGAEILVGRKGGMPALNFLNALKNAGINESEININYSVEFAALSGSFIGNVGDYVNLFEPNGTLLENEGYGYVLASIGQLSGEMPYTAFYTQKSYLEENQETLEKFTKALDKGLKYVQENDGTTIANAIINQFPDTSINDLATIITRYKDADSYLNNPYISENIFKNLEDVMIDNDLLDDYVPYDKLVKNLYNE